MNSSVAQNYTVLVGRVDHGGGYACVGAVGIWEISASCSQLCCKVKTTLKKSSLRKLTISYKLSSFTSLTTFQVLTDHMWVMVTSLDNSNTEHYTKVCWTLPRSFCIFAQSAVPNTQHQMWSLRYLIQTLMLLSKSSRLFFF